MMPAESKRSVRIFTAEKIFLFVSYNRSSRIQSSTITFNNIRTRGTRLSYFSSLYVSFRNKKGHTFQREEPHNIAPRGNTSLKNTISFFNAHASLTPNYLRLDKRSGDQLQFRKDRYVIVNFGGLDVIFLLFLLGY